MTIRELQRKVDRIIDHLKDNEDPEVCIRVVKAFNIDEKTPVIDLPPHEKIHSILRDMSHGNDRIMLRAKTTLTPLTTNKK